MNKPILRKLLLSLTIAGAASMLSNCSSVTLVKQDDLYKSADDMIEIDDVTTADAGFKSTLQRDGWDLVWQDEFSGPHIDTTKWNHEVNGDGGGNNELQYYTASKANSYIKDGFLVIKGIQQNYKGKLFTSARLNSKFKGDWKYGRFDIRAKTPVQQGIWPAIWMLPTDWVYGGWPQSGEIDIMESVGHEPATCYGTLHYGPPWPNNKHTGGNVKVNGTLADEFHVYSVEWDENEIRWYLDDVLFSKKTPADLDPHPWPFDQRFHMILNLAIGGNWPGPPDESTTFPKYMWVDYVRVFQRKSL
ncbi:MAG: family 16 glycosylhydrolase [Cytophagaceae bacterium]